MTDEHEVLKSPALERMKAASNERNGRDDKATSHSQGRARTANGTIERGNRRGEGNNSSNEGRDRISSGESAGTGGHDSVIGAPVNPTHESNSGSHPAPSGADGGASTDASIKGKPQGLKLKPSLAEKKARPEEEEKREAARAATSERMRAWWANKKAKEGQAETPGPTGPATKRGPGGRPLSEDEMNQMRPELIKVLMDYSEIMDEAIKGTSRTKAPCEIWAMDEEDATPLAEVLLMQARKSAAAAARVRGLIDSWAYIKTGAMLVPRFHHTIVYYTENGLGIFPQFEKRKRKNGQ